MSFNKNELILDRVRSVLNFDLSTGELLYRLTQIEDPSLGCSAEGEDVTDAMGSPITTLYRAKQATFSGTNSLVSLDLLAAQYGDKKEVASADHTITVPISETLEVVDSKITLSHSPKGEIKYIYNLIDGEIATKYIAGTEASETEFVVNEKVITVPTGVTGKIFVAYEFESTEANKITNYTNKFPEAVKLQIEAYFRDKCNENLIYAGAIVSLKAKLNPESAELNLTSTGKHGFEYKMMKDYCSEEGELFSVIIYNDKD